MNDDTVVTFQKRLDSLVNLVDRPRKKEPSPPEAEPEAAPAAETAEESAVSFDKLSLLPAIGDPYLKAYARPVTASLPMLVLLKNDGQRPTFSYGDLRFFDVVSPKRPGYSPGLLMRFLGIGTAELEGRNLERLHGYLYLHRLAWLRELPAGRTVREDDAVVITRIKVTLLEG